VITIFILIIINTSKHLLIEIMYILVPKIHQGEKIPTELQLEKAKVLCCFRLAKQ